MTLVESPMTHNTVHAYNDSYPDDYGDRHLATTFERDDFCWYGRDEADGIGSGSGDGTGAGMGNGWENGNTMDGWDCMNGNGYGKGLLGSNPSNLNFDYSGNGRGSQ
jgi:hypothetical protein